MPFYKAGPQNSFRSIMILPLLSKVSWRLSNVLEKYDILYKFQFGFKNGHLIYTENIHRIYRIHILSIQFYRRGRKIIISLILLKAFDTLHKKCTSRTKKCGIRGNSHNWINTYLTDRVQQLEYKDAMLNKSNITVRIPQ